MFNLPFSSNSSAAVPEGGADGSVNTDAPQQKTGSSRRSRRRRNARRTRVEPMVKASPKHSKNSNKSKHHDAPMTKNDLYFALDCEMVGIGPDGFDSAVARVTVINWEHKVVLDSFVKVPAQVTDYRTHVSGIRPQDIESESAISFEEAREAVENILRGKILIGHGLECDLCALGLTHPWCDVRDTARYAPYMREAVGDDKLLLRPRKLRDLAWEKLGKQIQDDRKPHCPIEDAAAALDLYKEVRADWEDSLRLEQAKKFQDQQVEQRKAKSFLGMPSSVPPPPEPMPQYSQKHVPYQHPYDPRLYNGPYGSKIPGFAPAPPLQQQPSYPAPTKQSSSRRWFSSRAKSPERSIKEDQEYQPTPRPMSPRSSGLFSFRRNSAARRGVLQSLSTETEATTGSEKFETSSTAGWAASDYGSQSGADDFGTDWSHNGDQQQNVDYWQQGEAPYLNNSTQLRSRLSTYLSSTSQEANFDEEDFNRKEEDHPPVQEWQSAYYGEWTNNFQIPSLQS